MNRYLFDTETFSHFLRDHPNVVLRLIRELSSDVFVSIITVEET